MSRAIKIQLQTEIKGSVAEEVKPKGEGLLRNWGLVKPDWVILNPKSIEK